MKEFSGVEHKLPECFLIPCSEKAHSWMGFTVVAVGEMEGVHKEQSKLSPLKRREKKTC